MSEKIKKQEEWLYDILGKEYGWLNGATLNKLSDEQEKEIKSKMEKYWLEHNDQSTEFLVDGAVLRCTQGDCYAKLDSEDHGVYTDSSGTMALANEEDKKISGDFGFCNVYIDSVTKKKKKCDCLPKDWLNKLGRVLVNGKKSLDTNSFLQCSRGGTIIPVTSGQEFTLGTKYNVYPRFLNDDGTVDELIVKKLLLRHTYRMRNDEIDALIKLGIYLCVCRDIDTLKKVINCAYIESTYNTGVAIGKRATQLTLLENFIYVSAWAEACCRFCAIKDKVLIKQGDSWDKYGVACSLLKSKNGNFNSVITEYSKINSDIEDMLLNVKLLETVIAAGNLYGTGEAVSKLVVNSNEIDFNGTKKIIKIYTLEYFDGQMVNKIRSPYTGMPGTEPGFITCGHKVHIFAASANKSKMKMREFINKILGSIGASVSGPMMAITYGTAAVSLMMADPIFSAISAWVGSICTIAGTAAGIFDSARSDSETEYSKLLASKAIDDCINMSLLSGSIGLYTVYAYSEKEQPEDESGAWESYESKYKGKTDKQARDSGFATRDRLKGKTQGEMQKLGLGYSCSISVIDKSTTLKKLHNFNNNMKNIRISGIEGFSAGKTEPKTISEGEGLGEFQECKTLTNLIDYMNNTTNGGEYYIDVLDVIGVEGSDIAGRIVYKLDNGEEKVMYEKGNLGLSILFEDNSK